MHFGAISLEEKRDVWWVFIPACTLDSTSAEQKRPALVATSLCSALESAKPQPLGTSGEPRGLPLEPPALLPSSAQEQARGKQRREAGERLAATGGYLRRDATWGDACPCRVRPHFIYSPSLT